MGETNGRAAKGPRCIALVGPYLSGKTTLLEAILFRSGAIQRQGKVGDRTHRRRCRPRSARPWHERRAQCRHGRVPRRDVHLHRLPGLHRIRPGSAHALAGCDAAVVVCEPDDKKVPALQLILKQLDELDVPRFIFVNKIDRTESRLRDVLAYMQPASSQAAGPAPDSDLEGRHRHGLRRSGARARLRLPPARAERGHRDPAGHEGSREGSALRHAREARRL